MQHLLNITINLKEKKSKENKQTKKHPEENFQAKTSKDIHCL